MLYFTDTVKPHDTWYKKFFGNPRVVEDLLTAFVKERFVKGLDFSSIKKLNASFVSEEFRNRESDVIYEIKSHGQTTYIYLLIEFQSTVDRFMALRMGSYVFQFHQEILETTGCGQLQPVFPILVYNGDQSWTAPETFRELLSPSDIPEKYLPDIRKITGLSSARIESLRKNRKMAPSARPRSRSALRTSHSALQKTGRRR